MVEFGRKRVILGFSQITNQTFIGLRKKKSAAITRAAVDGFAGSLPALEVLFRGQGTD